MLPFPSSTVYQTSKCYFTYGTMGHVDRNQLPSSKKPWSTIQSLDFIHRVNAPRTSGMRLLHRH